MMIKNYFTIFTLFFSVMPLTSFAWNAMGHQLVAQIAYEQLEPAAKAQVDDLLKQQFIKDSTWADKVRAQGDKSMNTWHYINLPHPGPQKNVVQAITDSEQVLNSKSATRTQKIRALRGLIHWVGDIHQPLHTIGRDRGGTLFVLADNPYGKNLHQLWDNGAGSFKHISKLALTARTWQKTYPVSSAQMQQLDPMQWAQEGYVLATTRAYLGIAPRTVPSPIYLEQAQDLTRRQIVLAGMRLAQILNRKENTPG